MLKLPSLLCLVSITLILLFGCCAYTGTQPAPTPQNILPPNGSQNTQQPAPAPQVIPLPNSSQNTQQNAAPSNHQISDAMNSMQIANQKLRDGGTAMTNQQYSEARNRLSEAKTYLISAKSGFDEACTSTPSLCSNISNYIQACLSPGVDLLMDETYLGDNVKTQCGSVGCPSTVISQCSDLISNSNNLDDSCNQFSEHSKSDFSTSITNLCQKIESVPTQTQGVSLQNSPESQLNQAFCSRIESTSPTVRDAAAYAASNYSNGVGWNIGQLYGIYQYTKSNVGYVSSPASGNYLANASETLHVRAGNCENQAILAVSMIRSIGGRAEIAIFPNCNHAFALAYVGSENQLQRIGNDIATLYGQQTLPYNWVQDKDGSYWLVVDTAGGRYLGDLLPACKTAISGAYTLNC